MQKKNHAILAAAALAAALPISAKAAVVINYSFDPSVTVLAADGVTVVSTTTLTPTVDGTGAISYTAHVPLGDFLQVNLDTYVSGDTNAAPTGTGVVPANLGLAAGQIGLSDGNKSIAVVENSGYWSGAADTNKTTGAANNNFGTSSAGVLDGNGGVTSNTGVLAGNQPANSGTSTAAATDSYGAGTTPVNLFGPLYLGSPDNPFQTAGTAKFTIIGNTAQQAYFTYLTGGGSGKGATAPQYQVTNMTSSDSLVLGSLNVVVGTVSAGHNIISLVAGNGTAGANYGSADGTIAVGGPGHSSYLVTPATGFTAGATGSTNVSGFSPTTDTEIYGLKLLVGGNAPTQTQLNQIVTDINGGTGDNVTAGLIGSLPAVFTSVFTTATSGYNLFLTSTNGFTATSGSDLGFDFSQETNVAGVTVAGIAAVPEPATAAGIVLGAAGLLLGRRRKATA